MTPTPETRVVPVKLTEEMKARVRENGGPQALAYAIAAWPDLLAAAPAAPAPEPVAWRYSYNGQWYLSQGKTFALNGFDLQPLYATPPAPIAASEITMGLGLVDVVDIQHEGRKGILFRPRTSYKPVGEPGELQDEGYWPVAGDVVIWIESSDGAQVIHKYLADFLPPAASAVKVLEWRPWGQWGAGTEIAQTPAGDFFMSYANGRLRWYAPDRKPVDCRTEAEAKAAAQADYERRVRACLELGQGSTVLYRNWRGEIADRTIIPLRIWHGATDWHPEPQLLLTAWDVDKQAERDFALADFLPPPPAAEEGR